MFHPHFSAFFNSVPELEYYRAAALVDDKEAISSSAFVSIILCRVLIVLFILYIITEVNALMYWQRRVVRIGFKVFEYFDDFD